MNESVMFQGHNRSIILSDVIIAHTMKFHSTRKRLKIAQEMRASYPFLFLPPHLLIETNDQTVLFRDAFIFIPDLSIQFVYIK